MAKNELLEDILDDLSVMKEKDEARDQRLDRMESALGDLVKAAGSTQPTTSTTQAESTNRISYDALKEAVYDAITEYHKAKPEHTDIFTEDNIRKLHSIINKADGEWLKNIGQNKMKRLRRSATCLSGSELFRAFKRYQWLLSGLQNIPPRFREQFASLA